MVESVFIHSANSTNMGKSQAIALARMVFESDAIEIAKPESTLYYGHAFEMQARRKLDYIN